MGSKAVKLSVSLVVMSILIIVLAIPFSLGFIVQKQYPKKLKAFQEKNPDLIVKVSDYHRGFFVTDIKLTLAPRPGSLLSSIKEGGSGEDLLSFPVKVNLNVHHGLLLLPQTLQGGSAHLQLGWFSINGQVTQSGLQMKAVSAISLTRQLHLNVEMKDMQLGVNDMRVQLQNARWSGVINPKAKKVNGLFDVDKVTVDLMTKGKGHQNQASTVVLKDLSVDLKHIQSINDILYGTRVISLSNLLIHGEGGEQQLHVKPVVLNIKTEQDGKETNSFIDYDFKGVTIDKQNFGPARSTISFKAMNTQKLRSLMKAAQKIQSSTDSHDLQAQQIQLLQPSLSLLAEGMSVSLSSQYDTGQGLVKADIDADMPKDTSGHASSPLFLAKVIMKGKLSAPLDWFKSSLRTIVKQQDKEKAQAQAKALASSDAKTTVPAPQAKVNYFKDLVDSNVIVVVKDRVELSMSYDDNGFLVNGKPLHLPPSFLKEF